MSILVKLYGTPMYISCPPAWFYPRVLVGAGMALTMQFAYKHNITHVINCATEEDSPIWFKKRFPKNYVCLNAVDSLNANILEWYPAFEAWMHTFLREGDGTVYVHCQAGMNRSGSLALAYVCKNFGLELDSTIQATRLQRPILFQNPVFMDQVKKFINGRVSSEENKGDDEWTNNGDTRLSTSRCRTDTSRLSESSTKPSGGAGNSSKGSVGPLRSE
jgi:protein-tyrosine phosphatase